MSHTRKTVWILFALFMFVQLLVAYMVDKNQENLNFLLNMKKYIPFMLYFSIVGAVLFLVSLLFLQIDNVKSKNLITQLENDKNQLKAKLFDMQEEKHKVVPTTSLPPKEEPKQIETLPQKEDDNSSENSSEDS